MRACPHCHLLLQAAENICPRDGERAEDVELAPVPPDVVAKLRNVEPFAHGSTGTSYRAVPAAGGSMGLLKVMPVADASERGRLKRELRKQAKLVNNSLVRILDGGEVGAVLWLLRDFAPGDSLAVRIRREGKLAIPEALAITAQIASGLDELHRAGLLHRDVKSGHVILEPRAEGVPLARLIDAGIAARLATGAALEPLGTASTIAPEQIEGKLVSFRSDLYSLGCVLHEMLTGAPPFSGAPADVLRAHREDTPPRLPREVPPAIESLVAALLAKDPRARPFSAQQVRRTMEPFLPAGTPPARSATQTSAGDVASPSGTRTTPGTAPLRAGLGASAVGGRASVFGEESETEELIESDLHPSVPPPVPGSMPAGATGPIDVAEVAVTGDAPVVDILRTGEAVVPASTPASIPVAPPAAGAASGTRTTLGTRPMVPNPAAQTYSQDDVETTPAAIVDASSDVEPSPASTHDSPASAPESARLVRPSVNFDVESLFAEDSAPESPALPDFVPSTRGAAGAAASGASLEADLGDGADDAYPPPSPRRGRLLIAGASVAAFVVIVLVVALWSGGPPDEPPAAATGANLPAAATDETSPSAEATPTRAAPARDGNAVPATAERADAPSQVGAAPSQVEEEPSQVAAAPGAAAAGGTSAAPPPAGAEPGSASGTVPTQPAPGAEAAREPTPERGRPSAVAATPGSARGSLEERQARNEQYKAEARALYQAGRYAQAAQAYERAARQIPSDSGAYAGLGASLLAAGQADGAIQAYQRAAQISPGSSGFHAALAKAYEQKGDLPRARAAYQRALQLNPQNQAASRGLARLGGAE